LVPVSAGWVENRQVARGASRGDAGEGVISYIFSRASFSSLGLGLGIEHPVLGLLTFALMAAFVVGAAAYLVVVGVEIRELVLSTPVVDGHAGCFSAGSDGQRYAYNLSLLVANSGRVDLRLGRLYLGSDAGLLEVGVAGRVTAATARLPGTGVNVTVYLYGFSGEAELRAGQRGLVWVAITSNASLYTVGKPYPVYARFTTLGEDAFAAREAWFVPGETPTCGAGVCGHYTYPESKRWKEIGSLDVQG
jgi:hypothetical protein